MNADLDEGECVMSYHNFGIMQTPPEHGKRYNDYEPEKYNCLSVNDDYIESIVNDLNNMDFHWHTIDSQIKVLHIVESHLSHHHQ